MTIQRERDLKLAFHCRDYSVPEMTWLISQNMYDVEGKKDYKQRLKEIVQSLYEDDGFNDVYLLEVEEI